VETYTFKNKIEWGHWRALQKGTHITDNPVRFPCIAIVSTHVSMDSWKDDAEILFIYQNIQGYWDVEKNVISHNQGLGL
jgi:hypothetical protein